jgi:hypothetical protein
MTLLISWIGVDEKKEGKSIASIYIASDSRYSWGTSKNYDYGVKVFGATNFPEIFGFSGDVLFPSNVLHQLLIQIDKGLIFSNNDNGQQKNQKVFEFISTSFKTYPKSEISGSFNIIHGTRIGKIFYCFKTSYSKINGLINKEIELPLISKKICSEGSGKIEFDKNYQEWEREKHNNYRTSRGVYHCLYDTLKNISDKRTGGLPQIVGLYREKNSKLFGIIENEKKYVLGMESSESLLSENIEWRNENFERMNPETLRIIEGAQRQPK